MSCTSRSCALSKNFQCNWAMWLTVSVLLHISLLSEQTAIAQCEQVICPEVDCANPIRLNGECCLICLDPVIIVDDSCLFEGIQIDNGDKFHPFSILENFNYDGNIRDECVECICENTAVTCRNASGDCPPLNCDESEAEYVDGECCKQCPLTHPDPRPSGPGCFDFDGNFFLDGQWWHPSLPDHGVVTCVNCTCENSSPRCWRLPCPEVPPCGPDDPVEDVVVCCPRCNPHVSPIPTENPTVISDNTTTPTDPIDFTPDITPCESPYIYKIYRHKSYDAMALHNMDTKEVELYNWTTIVTADGIGVNRTYNEMSASLFLSDEISMDYIFVGWTIDRRVRGLKNKRSKRERIEACTENCARMVTNMLRPVYTLSETLECGRR